MPPFFLAFFIIMRALCSELGTFSFLVCFFYFSRIGVNFLKTWKNFLVKTFGPRIWKFLVNDSMFFVYLHHLDFQGFCFIYTCWHVHEVQKTAKGGLFFFFYYIGSGDQTWVLSHGNWYLYLLSHLACPDFQIFDLVYIIV